MPKGRLKYLIFTALIIMPMVVKAQSEEAGARRVSAIRASNPVNQMDLQTKHKVDTLTFLDRIALRTNTVDWMLLMPNIGVEFDVKPVSWNRWTVGLNVRGNWQTKHTYTPGVVYNIFETRLEARQYWRTRDMELRHLEPHRNYWNKAISIRRKKAKHPMLTWYRGLYVGYGTYSLLFGREGHQGTALVGGGKLWIYLPDVRVPKRQFPGPGIRRLGRNGLC